MKCPKCGFENQEGSKYCSDCGTQLTIQCPNCHSVISPFSKFCNYCGQSLIKDEDKKTEANNDIDSRTMNLKTQEEKSASKKTERSAITLREVGSVLVVLLSIIFIVITTVSDTLDNLYMDSAYWLLICFFILTLYFGIRGFFSESKKYGYLMVIVAFVILTVCCLSVASLKGQLKEYETKYGGNYGSNQVNFSGAIILFVIWIIPSMFMCAKPRKTETSTIIHSKNVFWICPNCGHENIKDAYICEQCDFSVKDNIHYCDKCQTIYYGTNELINGNCPKCGSFAKVTNISESKWETLSFEERKIKKKEWTSNS